jgi:tRNA 2-thiouridine synthesizing protein E
MSTFVFMNKDYEVDSEGFLLDSNKWDEDFANGMAAEVKIENGLTRRHWDVIYFIRNTFKELGKCPLIYQTCKAQGIRLNQLRDLFPTGYLRGACKLAGITYKQGYVKYAWVSDIPEVHFEKVYQVDVRGFLIDPYEWDERFAVYKAYEMKMPEKLGDRHWQIIYFIRESFNKNKQVPTVYETCEANQIEIDELERLFPDGYHRGAVKIAGLRVK